MKWPFGNCPTPGLERQVIKHATALGWQPTAAESAARIAVEEYGPEPVDGEDLQAICAEVLRVDGECAQ